MCLILIAAFVPSLSRGPGQTPQVVACLGRIALDARANRTESKSISPNEKPPWIQPRPFIQQQLSIAKIEVAIA